jgi:Aspartyl protease
MKILKRKAEGEKSYASGKTLRTGTWEPTRAVEEEVEMEVETDETMIQTLEEKPRTMRAAPKRKFIDLLKEKANMEELLEEIMDQRVSIRLRDILTSSESLTKLMFKGLPAKEEIAVKVGSAALRQVERTYAAATPKVRVKIGSITIDTMLDSGAEVNVMTRSLADKAGLTVRTNLMLALKTVSGERRKFDGAYEDIEVSIGNISNT